MPLAQAMPSRVMSEIIFSNFIEYKTREEVDTAFTRAIYLIDGRVSELTVERDAAVRGEISDWVAWKEIFGADRLEIQRSEIAIKTGKIYGLGNIKATVMAYQTAVREGDAAIIDQRFRDFTAVAVRPGPSLIQASEFSCRTKATLIDVVSIIEGIQRFCVKERAAAATSSVARGAFVEMPTVTPPTPGGSAPSA